MKSYRIWLSIAAILFIGKMFGTVWTQAEDLGGFDVSVSEGENWSLPDNWQENTSGWEEEADTKSTAESENESFAQDNKIDNSVGESEDIFSSTSESIQQNNQQQNNLQNSNDQDINDQGNNNQGNNNQDINDRGNNNQESNDQESNYQNSNNQNNKMNNNNQNNNQNSTKQRSNRQENDGQDSVQPAHKQQSLLQRLSEEKSGEPKIPESKETGKIVEGELEPKVYVSQEERQKAKEQDRAVNFRRTKDMTFFHKKQAGKKDILYLTVTRLNIHQILSVRLNGKECRWNREGSRIVLEDRPEQGKNKVEVRFFLEDGQVRGMAPWIFTCD